MAKIPRMIWGIIIATFIAVVGYFSLSAFWFWVSLEIIAALLVAIGCSGEWWLHHHPAGRRKKEKDEHHKLESRFIAMVSLGVIMEIFALGHSIREGVKLENEVSEAKEHVAMLESNNLVLRSNVAALELQVMEAKTNIAQIDPRNATISEMSATAILIVKGTEFNDLTNWDSRRVARITLCQNDIRHIPNFDPLDADKFTRNDHKNMFDRENRQYGIRFNSFPFMAAMGVENPVKTIDDVNLLRLDVNFLPPESEISGGGVILRVNNSQKMFQFLPQIDTNPPDGRPGFPYMVLATNLDHIPIK